MLVLTRKDGEWIDIGDDIKIQVVQIKSDSVRIGIDAPTTFAVHRREIKERIEQDRIQKQKAEGKDAD